MKQGYYKQKNADNCDFFFNCLTSLKPQRQSYSAKKTDQADSMRYFTMKITRKVLGNSIGRRCPQPYIGALFL